MKAKLYGQKAGGMNINGIIEDYYVYAGENISAGDLVEFVNGIASYNDYGTSEDVEIMDTYGGNNTVMRAVVLSNNRVFVAYGGWSGFGGIVVTIEGATIQLGTSVQLGGSTGRPCAYGLSVAKLKNGNVFVTHKNYDDKYIYGIVCEINGTTITAGTDTQLVEISSTGDSSKTDTLLLDNGNIFIAYYSSYSKGIICTVSGTTITAGTETILFSTGSSMSPAFLPNNNIFIAYCRGSSYYLYGIVITISGTTITAGIETSLSTSSYDGSYISTTVLLNSNVFIAHSRSSDYYLNGMVVSISGTTITKGTDTSLVKTKSTVKGVNTITLKSGNVLITHNNSSITGTVCSIVEKTITKEISAILPTGTTKQDNGVLLLLENGTIFHGAFYNADACNAQMIAVKEDNTITNEIEVTEYETQVRKVTTPTFNGVAKTSGTGGDETGHKDKVSIYTI